MEYLQRAILAGGVAKVIDKLRLKATYGLVGNDAISSNRFFYLSDVNMNDTGKNVWYGTDFNVIRPGITVRRYSNNDITWEIARKLNLGFEMRLFDKVELQVDYFTENRSNILLERTNLPSSMGLEASKPPSRPMWAVRNRTESKER